MSDQASSGVLHRFILLMAVLTFIVFSVWMVVGYVEGMAPGDYEVRQGDIHLSGGEYEAAIADFEAALEAAPNHRGALMGKAIAYMQMGRPDKAEAEFTALIDFLEDSLKPEDTTGVATLAAAYGNRGILRDRQGRYEEALADYVSALKIDAEGMEGPGVVDKVLYATKKPSSVRDRARYLYEQLQKPEDERLLRVPEIDNAQFMYKP